MNVVDPRLRNIRGLATFIWHTSFVILHLAIASTVRFYCLCLLWGLRPHRFRCLRPSRYNCNLSPCDDVCLIVNGMCIMASVNTTSYTLRSWNFKTEKVSFNLCAREKWSKCTFPDRVNAHMKRAYKRGKQKEESELRMLDAGGLLTGHVDLNASGFIKSNLWPQARAIRTCATVCLFSI